MPASADEEFYRVSGFTVSASLGQTLEALKLYATQQWVPITSLFMAHSVVFIHQIVRSKQGS